MAPLPLADPDAPAMLHRFLSTISSLFKSKTSFDPLFKTSPEEEVDSIELQDFDITSFPPSPRISVSDLPTGFKLKPPGPEKEPWLEILELQDTDQYRELTSNLWTEKYKRSIQDGEPLVTTIKSAGIDALVRRQPEGESGEIKFWTLMILMFVGIMVVGGAFFGVIIVVREFVKYVKKRRSGRSSRLEGPGEDRRM